MYLTHLLKKLVWLETAGKMIENLRLKFERVAAFSLGPVHSLRYSSTLVNILKYSMIWASTNFDCDDATS